MRRRPLFRRRRIERGYNAGAPGGAEVLMRPAIRRTWLAFFALWAAAAPAFPGAPAPETCPAIDVPAVPAPGVRAFVDPATGKLRPPTAEEKFRLAAAVRNRSERIYEVVVRPDGTRVVELDDAFSMSVVATRRPDGTLQYRCVTGRPPEPK